MSGFEESPCSIGEEGRGHTGATRGGIDHQLIDFIVLQGDEPDDRAVDLGDVRAVDHRRGADLERVRLPVDEQFVGDVADVAVPPRRLPRPVRCERRRRRLRAGSACQHRVAIVADSCSSRRRLRYTGMDASGVPLTPTCSASELSHSDTTAPSAEAGSCLRPTRCCRRSTWRRAWTTSASTARTSGCITSPASSPRRCRSSPRSRRAPSASRSAPASSTCGTRTRCTSPRKRHPSISSASGDSRSV